MYSTYGYTYIYAYVRMYGHRIYVRMYVRAFTFIHIDGYEPMHICIGVTLCIRVYTRRNICMHIHRYMQSYIHTYRRIYIRMLGNDSDVHIHLCICV